MTDARTEAQMRASIVAEAYTFLRTPYRHCANIKGVGVDCAMLLVEVYRTVVPHIVPLDFDPRPYSPEWHLHRDEEKYLLGLGKYAHQVEHAQLGDVEAYRFGRTTSHAGIVVSDEFVIHATNRSTGGGQVELCERRFLLERFDSAWSVF